MTRINCIPVTELTNKHLVAEYRELPRVFKLARPAPDAPLEYTLGKGHVLFFYDKLKYCYQRQKELYNEMLKRGFKPTFDPEGLKAFYQHTNVWNDWTPTPEALAINRERIRQRLQGIKT
jgi:deoxyribonuclease (pyrimidine dimer)